MQFLLVAGPLHLYLEPLITPGILTDVGVAGIVLLLLHLILPGVLRPLVVLEVPAVSEWPEETMIVTISQANLHLCVWTGGPS